MTKYENLSQVFFDITLCEYKLKSGSYKLFPKFTNLLTLIQGYEDKMYKTPLLLTNTNYFFSFLLSYIYNEDKTSYQVITKMSASTQITLSENQLIYIINWFATNENIDEQIKSIFIGLDVENLYNLGILVNNTLGRVYDVNYLLEDIKELISSRSSSPSNKLRSINLMNFGINSVLLVNLTQESLSGLGIPSNIYNYGLKNQRTLDKLDKLSDLLV